MSFNVGVIIQNDWGSHCSGSLLFEELRSSSKAPSRLPIRRHVKWNPSKQLLMTKHVIQSHLPAITRNAQDAELIWSRWTLGCTRSDFKNTPKLKSYNLKCLQHKLKRTFKYFLALQTLDSDKIHTQFSWK